MKKRILEQYYSRFEHPLVSVIAPGRANIIGEHTDYNHGLALPFAINQHIEMVIGQNFVRKLRIYASDIDEYTEIDLSELEFQSEGWTRYIVNSLVAIDYSEPLGIDVVFGGNLPQGGGVSSSSAITCGFLAGINTLHNFGFSQDELIDLASQAENGIGLHGGIMDQTTIIKGKKGSALLIDFLDSSVQYFDMPNDDYTFYLFNSGQKHNLVETEYNKRRSTCEQALKTIQAARPEVKTLRDVTRNDIETYLKDDISKKRCMHVLEENKRVIAISEAHREKRYEIIGPILLESHQSLSQKYEVSTPEIDFLVKRSQQIHNVSGSRIMGGGFGGCTINFVKGKLDLEEVKKLKEEYTNRTGFELQIDEITAGGGVRVMQY